MYKKILVPVAPDHDRDIDRALDLARHLRDADGEIVLLSVVELIPTYIATYVPDDQMDQQVKAVRESLQQAYGAAGYPIEIAIGHSSQTILDWAERHEVDCIVVASHRPGLQDFFLGSTAARVVRHAKCPVMVLR